MIDETADAEAELVAESPPEEAPEEGETAEEELSDTENLGVVQEVPEEIRRAIEALIMVADVPVPTAVLAQLTEVSAATVMVVCEELAAEYEAENRGFVLVNVAGGYRFQTHDDLAPYIERFALEGQSSRLSAAALETLAIVAYKQPLSRAQVSAIRGVGVDAVMRTLQQRGYIAEIERDDGPGLAILFGTTPLFLERIGLASIDELPALGDFAPDSEVVEALEQSLSADPIEDELLPQASPEAAAEISEISESIETADTDEIADAGEASGNDNDDESSADDRLDAVVIDLRDSMRQDRAPTEPVGESGTETD